MPHTKAPPKPAAVAKLALDLLRESIYPQVGKLGVEPDQWGTLIDLMVIQFALVLGQADGKLMSATKVSQYLGLPRTTVIRKLNQMLDAGVVEKMPGNRYRLAQEYLHSKLFDETFKRKARHINRTACLLSKTDT